MSELIEVSVVVPTRDRCALLRDGLESLAGQLWPVDRMEIVVVDDGSGDRTAEVVAEIRSAVAVVVRYLRLEGGGVNAARNAGIAAARAELVCLVDDDAWVPTGWLPEMMAGVGRHPDAECFGGPYSLRLEGPPPRLCDRRHLGDAELDLGPEERAVEEVWGCNLALRKSAVRRVGGFDEELSGAGDEVEWQRRLRRLGGEVWYLPKAFLWHRRTAAELRLGRLVRARFRRERQRVRFERRNGGVVAVAGALRAAVSCFGHALGRRCAGGLIDGAGYLGRGWGALVERS